MTTNDDLVERLRNASPWLEHIRELFEKAPFLRNAEGFVPGAHPVTWRDLASLTPVSSTHRGSKDNCHHCGHPMEGAVDCPNCGRFR